MVNGQVCAAMSGFRPIIGLMYKKHSIYCVKNPDILHLVNQTGQVFLLHVSAVAITLFTNKLSNPDFHDF
jgi:pyruvate/2-oxoglutarate/acetoin dehydrogenase E1 component